MGVDRLVLTQQSIIKVMCMLLLGSYVTGQENNTKSNLAEFLNDTANRNETTLISVTLVTPTSSVISTSTLLYYSYIGCGGVGLCVIIVAMFCCCRKRKNRSSRSVRSHQPLCNKDSGTVGVHVQRVAGQPISRNISWESNTESTHGVPATNSLTVCADSPGRQNVNIKRDASFRDTQRNHPTRNSSFYRQSPQIDRLNRDSSRNSSRFHESYESAGNGSIQRLMGDSSRFQESYDSSGRVSTRGLIGDSGRFQESCDSTRGGSTRRLGDSFRSNALESAICRFGRRFDDDQQTQKDARTTGVRDSPKSRDSSSLGDGFTLSSSFEGGLDRLDVIEPGAQTTSKLSSYDNLNATNRSDENMEEMEMKQSLYDNMDDGEARPLMTSANLKQFEETYAENLLRRPSPSPQRRSSRTLPLRFTMFNGGQYSERIFDDDDDDQDYVNVPSLGNKRSPNLPKPERGSPASAEKKTRYRRGSQTLKIFCSNKPPIMNKIEKQVLAIVPILGEPTPEPNKSQANPLDTFEFPKPPVVPPTIELRPPTSPENTDAVTSYINPMYSPTTTTPGSILDSSNPFNKPNAYFSF